jgi:predicted restriction endonuclease
MRLVAVSAAGGGYGHIRPYGDGGAHEAQNGLLLRRDIHSLFDAGYVTATPDLRFEVSRRIKGGGARKRSAVSRTTRAADLCSRGYLATP